MVIPHRFRRAGVLIAAAALSISVFAAGELYGQHHLAALQSEPEH